MKSSENDFSFQANAFNIKSNNFPFLNRRKGKEKNWDSERENRKEIRREKSNYSFFQEKKKKEKKILQLETALKNKTWKTGKFPKELSMSDFLSFVHLLFLLI